jgi:hypothetical protein
MGGFVDRGLGSSRFNLPHLWWQVSYLRWRVEFIHNNTAIMGGEVLA